MTSIAGTMAGLALVVAFFLPWVGIDEAFAARFAARVEEDLARGGPEASARPEVWRRLARHVAEERTLSGLDLFWWARTARVDAASEGAARLFQVIAVALAALPLAGAVLAGHFVAHRLRRARSPVLALAMVAGAASVGVSAAWGIHGVALGGEVRRETGLVLLPLAGALLLLAGAFGVRARNWWRVFGGAGLLAAALGLAAWAYLRAGAVA